MIERKFERGGGDRRMECSGNEMLNHSLQHICFE